MNFQFSLGVLRILGVLLILLFSYLTVVGCEQEFYPLKYNNIDYHPNISA
jgi:hypothetical protein